MMCVIMRAFTRLFIITQQKTNASASVKITSCFLELRSEKFISTLNSVK